MSSSFQEKSVYVQLAAILLGAAVYCLIAAKLFGQGVTLVAAYLPLLAISVVFTVIVLVAGQVVAVLTSRQENRDERDTRICWRAEHRTGWILAVGVLGGVTALGFSVEPLWVAHLLLLSLYLSEAAACILKLTYYRRGV